MENSLTCPCYFEFSRCCPISSGAFPLVAYALCLEDVGELKLTWDKMSDFCTL